MIPIGSLAGNAQNNVNVILPPPFSLQSAPLLQQGGLGQKRTYLEDPSLSASLEESIHPSLTLATVEKLNNRKKGRKKSYIWAHAVADESGKVYCKHCNTLIKVNFGEKVERLRRHFIKTCTKSPFHKDSKEYEELLDSVNAPLQENKKRCYVNPGKMSRSNRVISYSVGFVATVLSGPCNDLTKEQIHKLEAQGNRSTNWSAVKLTGLPTISCDSTLERIRGCYFNGNIFIGVFMKSVTMSHGISVPCGLYNSNFSGTCVLSDNCYIFNTGILSNVFVGRNSSVMNCSQVICEGNTSYGTQRTICVGSETGVPGSGRSIQLNVTSSYYEVCTAAMTKSGNVGAISEDSGGSGDWNKKKRNKNDDSIRYDISIICDDVEIVQCHLLRNVFIGSYSRITSSSVDSCTLLSHCTITTSECTDCVIHGNCSITSHCICNGVLMFPQCSISMSAKVEESVMGPDSSISVGECKRCLLGPFVGFHHQGLLISTLWPLGRGNIAYGAMIGANHTGRTNDQECIPGEGCFFGLGSSVKFPFNMMYSPYSMIASNTQCNPQKIAFPFSLISNYDASDDRGLSSRNMLRIGWVLWSNPYMIERAAIKYSKRRKSPEYRTDFPVFRPSVIDMMIDARNRLIKLKRMQVVPAQDEVTVLNLEEQHLPGVGRCLILSTDIDRAIDAYTQVIRRYTLHGLLILLCTADSCKSDPEAGHGDPFIVNDLPLTNALDSDSEDEDSQVGLEMVMQQQQSRLVGAMPANMSFSPNLGLGLGLSPNVSMHTHSAPNPVHMLMQQQQQQQQQPSIQTMVINNQQPAPPGPYSSLLEDVRRMEVYQSCNNVEEYLLRSEQRRGSLADGIGSNNKRAIMEFANNAHGNGVMGALLARNGSCCLLTDSHVYAVRYHQLQMLYGEFSGIDFVLLLDSCPRGGVLGQSLPSNHYEKLRQLLQLVVELERNNTESIRQCRRKDLLRANEIIPSTGDVNALVEEDEVVQRARCRWEDVGLCVHRIISQLHI